MGFSFNNTNNIYFGNSGKPFKEKIVDTTFGPYSIPEDPYSGFENIYPDYIQTGIYGYGMGCEYAGSPVYYTNLEIDFGTQGNYNNFLMYQNNFYCNITFELNDGSMYELPLKEEIVFSINNLLEHTEATYNSNFLYISDIKNPNIPYDNIKNIYWKIIWHFSY